MKKITLLALLLSKSLLAQYQECDFGKSSSCPSRHYCAKIEKNKDLCLPLPNQVAEVPLPFANDQDVTCYKSVVLDQETSHAYDQSRFAIDLYSPYGVNASLFSVFDGTAYIHDSCETDSPSSCGEGYGNSVKIIGDNGYMAFYAHLKEVFVKNGQRVKKGQFLGLEGATGKTGSEPETSPHGFKHLHFSMHEYRSWGRNFDRLPFPGFSSIPVKFNVIREGKKETIDVRNFPCHHPNREKVFLRSWW